MKYIVYWLLVYYSPTACPDSPKPDEFGRIPLNSTTCAAMHVEEKKEQHSKEFATEIEARAFMKRANKKDSVLNHFGMFESSKIDSVTLYVKE